MLSAVLNSDHAVRMSILIVRAFVKLRELLATHKDLAQKMEKLEQTQKQHASVLIAVVEDIRKMKTAPLAPPRRRIGFHIPAEK